MPSAPRVFAWAQADQELLLRDALEAGGLSLAAVGSPSPQSAGSLAKAFDVPPIEDLRQAIQRDDIDLLLLAAPDSAGDDALRLMGERRSRAFSCEPRISSISALAGSRAVADIDFVPLMRRSPGFRIAQASLPQFGQPQCVNVFFRSGPGQGSLAARLYDAMDVIHHLCGRIETINAGLAGPLPQPPEALPGLRGHLTANLRFKPNRCACVALSDGAGAWFRGVTVLGEGGCLRISDGEFEWIGPDGHLIDSQHSPTPLHPGALVGMQVRRALDGLDTPETPPDALNLLALCEAARLSCLTGQDENPGKLIEMMSRP